MTTDERPHVPVDLSQLVCSMCGALIGRPVVEPHRDEPRALVPENVDQLILEHEKTCPKNT